MRYLLAYANSNPKVRYLSEVQQHMRKDVPFKFPMNTTV